MIQNHFIYKLVFVMISLIIGLSSTPCRSQSNQRQNLKNEAFQKIDSNLQKKIESFERGESLTRINDLLLSDYDEDQLNILKTYKLQALVATDLFDEALALSIEMLEPVRLDPKLEVSILLERSLLFEILENMPESKKDLNRIKRLYDNDLQKTDENYGRYLFRRSSWFRVNHRREESLTWAHKAIDYGIKHEFPNVSATGFLLLGLNTDPSDFKEQRNYLNKGLTLWKIAGREPGVVNMYNNLAASYYQQRDYKIAQTYNDSALQIINRNNTPYERSHIYKQRSSIAEALNQADTALFYQKKYAEAAINALERSRAINVSELEYEVKKEKAIMNNITLQTKLDEAARKETYFVIGLFAAAFFLLTLGFLIITLASRNKRIQEQNSEIKETNNNLSNSIEEKEFLLKEVNHRVKNNLAFVQSLITFQIDEAKSPETSTNLERLNNRIHAIAVLHDQFVEAKNSISKKEIFIAPYIETIADAQIMGYQRRLSFHHTMNNIKVNLETAVPLGILVNELITNSIKHATPPGDKLIIEVTLKEDNGQLLLLYQDNGTVFKTEGNHESLGLYIIKTMVLQLRGTIDRIESSYSILMQRRK